VFVSNDGTNGVIGGRSGRRTRRRSASTRWPSTPRPTATAVSTIVGDLSLGTAGDGRTPENRLQFAISLAQSQVVNTKAAERIRDATSRRVANLTRTAS
jgi:flagellin